MKTIEVMRIDTLIEFLNFVIVINLMGMWWEFYRKMNAAYGSRYSRIDQVKFVEDSH